MTQHYSRPARAADPHALPDLETFHSKAGDRVWIDDLPLAIGWYYWHCFPGCLPDSDPIGPFATEAEALASARLDAADLDRY